MNINPKLKIALRALICITVMVFISSCKKEPIKITVIKSPEKVCQVDENQDKDTNPRRLRDASAICDEAIVDKTSSIYPIFIDTLRARGIAVDSFQVCDCNKDLILIKSKGDVELIGAVESTKKTGEVIGLPILLTSNFFIDIDLFDLPQEDAEQTPDNPTGQNTNSDSTVYILDNLIVNSDLSQFDNFAVHSSSGGTHKIGINDCGTDTRGTNNILEMAGWKPASMLGSCFGSSTSPFGVNIPVPGGSPTDLLGHGVSVNSVFLNGNYVNPEGGNFEFINTKFTENATTKGSLMDLLCGMHYLIQEGANPINVSAGFDTKEDSIPLIDRVVDLAEENGIVLVAGTGNGKDGSGGREGQELGSINHFEPARSFSKSEIGIAVGATNKAQDRLASFSNWSTGPEMTITAQGEEVLCIVPGYITGSRSATKNHFIHRKGTSFSTPQVAGTVAAIFEVAPCIPPEAIKGILLSSGTTVPFATTPGLGSVPGNFILLNHNEAILQAQSLYSCP